MIPPPPFTVEQVLRALEKQSKNKVMDYRDDKALQYYKRHQQDEGYMQKLRDAKEIIAARQSNLQRYQPLMPTMPSHRTKFLSPSSRIDRQRHTAPSKLATPHRSQSSSECRSYGRQNHTSPSVLSHRYRSRSPNISIDQNQSSPDIMNTGALDAHLSISGFDHGQFQSVTDESFRTSVSSPPVMEKTRFYSRQQRSPTPINDDHIVDDDCDWNLNSRTSQNSNATPSVSANNSQGEQIDEPAPFIMGTLKNLDNSCYMNSLLYILRMTPTFVHSIHHLLQNMQFLSAEYDENMEDMIVAQDECLQLVATSVMMSNKEKWPQDVEINDSQKQVVQQLHHIFAKLTDREKHQDNEPIEKKKFQAAVRRIAPDFTIGRQEDAHEFLLIILNCIRDCGTFLMGLTQKHASMFEKYVRATI